VKNPARVIAFSIIFLTLLVGALWLARADLSGLPVYSELPDFSLINTEEKPVDLSALKGKVWVADFIFTRCEDTCPLESDEMARLQNDFKGNPDFRLVSITADPDFDSPALLKLYAKRYNANPQKWFFLTGEKERIRNLVTKGFRLAILTGGALLPSRNSVAAVIVNFLVPAASAHSGHNHGKIKGLGGKITHSSRFVLVDQSARIRGYYHSDDPESLKKLRMDIRKLF
jgi:protein SCO1/2